MGSRFVLILILGLILRISDARFIDLSEIIVVEVDNDASNYEIKEPELALQNEKVCKLCEEFTSQAVEFLHQNKTQTQIIDSLHNACSQLRSLEQQCLLLVDYYAPLFFMEIDMTNPEKFCKKVNLCEREAYIPLQKSDDTCSVCQQTVAEVLLKLKDPNTKLEIIAALIKACNKMENYAQQCKKLIFEYGPVILINAEKFLETTDLCTYIHACKPTKEQAIMQVRHSRDAVLDS